ncbi:MAG TPA: hypothetical protein VI704_00815, partial [Bacteroidota bacterium]|nr:hypothetical protein [Bacteroidota bacterium]
CTTFHDRIFLRNLDLHAPLVQIPVHIADPESKTKPLTISPWLSTSPKEAISKALEPEYRGLIPDTLSPFVTQD